MGDVTRTVIITEEQDDFIRGVMARNGWSRSQVVRTAIDKLRADPVLFLGADTSDAVDSHKGGALATAR